MIHGYDDAAYYLDYARERCVDGDLVRASDAARAAASALGPSGGDTATYAVAAANTMAETPADTARATRYLTLAAEGVEELLARGAPAFGAD